MSEIEKPDLTPEQEQILAQVVRRTNILVYATGFIVVVALLNIMAPQTMEKLFQTDTSSAAADSLLAAMEPTVSDTLVVDGIHMATGLIVDDGFEQVKASCTACHSSKLITQNKADRDGWKKMIRWMQETQNLWDLGPNEDIILDYLAKNYAPTATGRRMNLTNIEWYTLED
ncbi:MAG: monoheme cytochrome C [Flavobacteriales bacterium]|nr:monoheme cytochrome C [Flavobacteriales bacterium]